MRNGKTGPLTKAELRRRAEGLMKSSEKATGPSDSEADLQKLLQELQIHQIELEMQNEELRRAQLELEASQTRYFDLYDLAPVGYFTLTEKGLILEANLTAATMLGMTRGALIKQPISRYILDEDQDIYYLHHKQLFETHEPKACELRMVKEDGTALWVHLQATVVQDVDGAKIGRVVIGDITERIQLERQAARAEKLEAIGTLAAGIAHDFNNLLGAMFGYLELSKKEAERTHQKNIAENLSKAFDAFEKAKRLTDQLLTFTKGGAPVRTTKSLTDLVRKTVSFSLSGSNVTPVFDIPFGIWLCSFDENQISQVIDHIIINALQAMHVGGTVEVSIMNVSSEDIPENYPQRDYVRISIRDYGTGISPEHLPKIFDPFFSTKTMGSGLGLATSYSIIRQHDGFIEVESEVGKFTTFHIYLPASQE